VSDRKNISKKDLLEALTRAAISGIVEFAVAFVQKLTGNKKG